MPNDNASFDIFRLLTRERPWLKQESPPPPPRKFAKSQFLAYKTLAGEERKLDLTTLQEDSFPIPPVREREHYCADDHWWYWCTGLIDSLRVEEAIEAHADTKTTDELAVMHMGCASGRVLRQYSCQSPQWEVWGCDVDVINVNWVKRHLASDIRCFQNSYYPSLPLPDASLDAVSGFSVFTHIDTFSDAWLLELRRVLKPGGLAYVTMHTERAWDRVRDLEHVLQNLVGKEETSGRWVANAELFDSPMPSDRIVFRGEKSAYHINTFQTLESIHDEWGRYFEICADYDAGDAFGFQDVLVLRRSS